MNTSSLDLQSYGVETLATHEAEAVNGGMGFWATVGAALLAATIIDSIQNPDDFMAGYRAARS